ncbi:ABC transporter permease [Brevibacillus dissolubilis]|uniref:ABC transporter permease n=1 Tax=Brevibacillus dissolubilis TaxID=1844116 RepID=UPI0011163AB3|nr:FtsX-like permease family protein [Brevibacillus dissolubilis]
MRNTATIAWRNLKRKPARTVLLMGSAAITAFLLFASYFFLHSMERSVQASGERLGADLYVVPKGYGGQAGEMTISGTATRFYMSEHMLEPISRIPEVEHIAPQLYLQTVNTVCCKVEGEFPIVAFDPNRDFTLQAWTTLKKGEFAPNELLIGSEAGGKNYLYHYDYSTIQEKVVLFNHTFLVRNLLFPTGMGTDKTIFMHLDTARRLIRGERLVEMQSEEQKHGTVNAVGVETPIPDDAISILLIKAKPGTTEFVKRQIERLQLPVDVVKGTGLRDSLKTQLFPVKILSYAIITMMILMSGLQAATMFSAIISERRKEIGMLRAMGASRWTASQLLLTEAGLAGLIGGMVGVTLSYAGLYDNRVLIMQLMKLPLLFPDLLTGLWLGLIIILLTVMIAVVAAWLPIRSALRIEPYEAIREGE